MLAVFFKALHIFSFLLLVPFIANQRQQSFVFGLVCFVSNGRGGGFFSRISLQQQR